MSPRPLRDSPGLLLHILFIGVVSVYDAWLVIAQAEEIMWHEKNAVGRYLIQLADGDVRLFVICKLISTTAALGILAWLGRYHHSRAVPVARSLTIFQSWLLWFLTCSIYRDPLIPFVSAFAVAAVACICSWSCLSENRRTLISRRIRLLLAPQFWRHRRAIHHLRLATDS